ncbi:unnamed protein product [Lactuca virosa]|uniref:Retrotransposon gag domain-containing protein n=1 Tax=Lactuca virosa TaxID=75947 RepID=A0AAU9NL17_9ASTR|nr:unnamed protein product [Lactuca virosa]
MTKPVTRSESTKDSTSDGDRDRLEEMKQEINSIKADAEKRHVIADQRHAELMGLLLKVSQTSSVPPLISSSTSQTHPPPPSSSLPPPPPSLFQSVTSIPIPTLTTHLTDRSFQHQPHLAQFGREDQRGQPTPFTFGDVLGSSNGRDLTGGHKNGGGWVPGTDYRLRKLKMPLFEGEDAFGWVYKVERFFEIQGLVSFIEKLRATVLCLEGPVLAWYRWNKQRPPCCSWDELKIRLLDRFQPSLNGSLHEQFLKLTQKDTACEYVGRFEALAAQLSGIPEPILEGNFIKGLKPELRTSVLNSQPVGLS